MLLSPTYHKDISYNCISTGSWSMTLILKPLAQILMSNTELSRASTEVMPLQYNRQVSPSLADVG